MGQIRNDGTCTNCTSGHQAAAVNREKEATKPPDFFSIRLALGAASDVLHIARNAAGMGSPMGRRIQDLMDQVVIEMAENEVAYGKESDRQLAQMNESEKNKGGGAL